MELNTIYCMDCLDGMKEMEDKSVDLVLTDPPYNINLTPPRGLTESILNDNMGKDEFIGLLQGCAEEFKRLLKDDTFFITFCGWSTIPEYRSVFDEYFTLKSMPVWIKNNFGIGYYTRPQYEPCLLYLNGEPNPLEKPISDVWRFNRVMQPVHSCEKPVGLMEYITNTFSKPNDLILDPFIGSGTTAVACAKHQRNFIGFELEQKYVDIANKRVKPWLQQERLQGVFE